MRWPKVDRKFLKRSGDLQDILKCSLQNCFSLAYGKQQNMTIDYQSRSRLLCQSILDLESRLKGNTYYLPFVE